MKQLVQFTSFTKPDTIINLGNGEYYYVFNIEPTEVKVPYEDRTEQGYSFNKVTIQGYLTYAKCVRAVIRAYVSVDDEFDLINTANRALMGLLSEDEKTKALNDYNEYLNMVSNIKQKIRKDFEQ